MSMTITLRTETERLVRKELQNEHFHTVDEIIVEGVQARREKEPLPQAKVFRLALGPRLRLRPVKTFAKCGVATAFRLA